ncbi:hypothetical protein RIF29_24642 [Crotalaria pallida]|uniref:BHLH domain-containing protein n=1 Tax=Crotalaria pallida TaxID=3830 RepID=A0AAN9EKU1_CROPI
MNTTASCAVDQSSLPENDFFELVWENGQISMMGQSSRARKIPTYKTLPSHNSKVQDKGVGYANSNGNGNSNGTNIIRMVKFGGELDNGLNEIRMQDEEVLPWLNYGMDETLQHDYSSDFLHEFSGVTINDFSLLDKRSSCNQVFRDSNKNSSSFASSVRSKVSGIAENNSSNVGETTQIPCASSGFSSLRMEKRDSIMNFSHFARPAAIVKANLQNIHVANKNKGTSPAATRSNPAEVTKVFSGECPKETAIQSQRVMEPSKADSKPLEPKSIEQNAAVSKKLHPTCKEDVSKIDQTSNLVIGESGSKEQEVVEKRTEPAVASSSVCSGNGAERCSDDKNQNLKRKGRDAEDSEWQSEDVDEESVGVKKTGPARGALGSKRSRSAEVHNLSERRRRDRINEKMRALQELIPNCNKVDKASMLDEAIEYLKTLQLQVQIMSMGVGAGLYMPTMMLPMGMPNMHAPHMPPFSPMAQLAYGMRMPEINGGAPRFPMAQVPQMQGSHHLPATHMSGATDLHAMARSNPQGLGLPSQGLSVPIQPATLFPFQGEPLMSSSSLGLNSCATSGLMETVDSASAPSLKIPMPNGNVQNTNGCNSASQMSNQVCFTERFKEDL